MSGADEITLRDTLTVTEEHPFWVKGDAEREGRWVRAGDLEAGDVVESAFDGSGRGQVVVESVEAGEVATVYNFAVEGDATYFVGKFAAWVHNSCFPKADTLARALGTTKDGFHRGVKLEILKDAKSFMKAIGSKNPDIGVKDGMILLRNPKTGASITTDLHVEWFTP